MKIAYVLLASLISYPAWAQNNINVLAGPAPMGVQSPAPNIQSSAPPSVSSGMNNRLAINPPTIIIPPIPGTTLNLPPISTPSSLEDQIKTAKDKSELPSTPVADTKDACSGNDLAQILSPACLDILKSVRPTLPNLAPNPVQNGTQCNVSIYPYGANLHGGGVVSFMTSDLPRCVEMATKMSFGIPSITNISTLTSTWGIIGIMCKRTNENPSAVSCNQQ